jgi:hypothetical protein
MTTTPNPTRPAQPAPRPSLPKGLQWSNVWKVDGRLVESDDPGVKLPVNEQWEICGQLWVCPAAGCGQEKWTFDPVDKGDEPCCPKHPARLVATGVDGADADPVQGARNRVSAWAAGVYERRKRQVVQTAQARSAAAQQAVADAARTTVADMRGHAPSIVVSGAALVAGTCLELTEPGWAAVVGAGVGSVGAVAAYCVAYLIRYWRSENRRDAKRARKNRAHARHVASGVLAAGIWLVGSGVVAPLGVFWHSLLTLLFGLLLTFAVNHAHWQELWATRHRLKDLARRRAEAEARRAAEAARLAEQDAPPPSYTAATEADESDPAAVGERMAAEWARIAGTQAAATAFPQMPRTWINPAHTQPVTAPINGEVVRIGWEYHGQSQPGALVAARGSVLAPVVAARDWLAAVLFDGCYNPANVSLVDRPGGQANRFTLMVTDSVPLGEPVKWQGKAGVKRLPDGTVLVHRGRSIDGNDVHHPLYVPGQAFGGQVVGTRGGGKTAGTILHLMNCLAAGVFPVLFDPKQLVDYADFIGVFPIGVTLAHRDVITDWLVAERKRRERLMARRPVLDEFGRQVHGESMWDLKDGPAISHNWEEFHDLAQDEAWVTGRLTNHLRFERAVWMGGRLVSQAGGLSDWGNSVLRGLLNQTEQTTYRMDDHQARLAGRKDGTYSASDLPALPGMCLVSGPEMTPLPMRDAFIPRKVNDPGSVFNQLYGRSAEKVLQFDLPPLPDEMVAVLRRTGLQELWDRAMGPDGLDRLLADAEDEEYGGPSPVGQASMERATGQAMEVADVLLAILWHKPGSSRAEIDAHPAWTKPAAGARVPNPSTVSKAVTKLETLTKLVREGSRDRRTYRLTEKATPDGERCYRTLFGASRQTEDEAERDAEESA